jgi:pyruvate dehydrogenase E2 component (dihydrolipoamide acetyltransferase)
MAIPVVMPKLAMGQTEGTVVEWLAEEGDLVEKGQQVMVIETEKVAYETEAPASGFFHPVVDLNVTVPVLETVALLAETEEELAELQAGAPSPTAPAYEQAAPMPGISVPAPKPVPAVLAETVAALPVPGGPVRTKSGRAKISPVAKKLALHHSLDINTLAGSGPGGRIVKRDVDQALAGRDAAPAAPALDWTGEVVGGKRVRATLPLKGMRRAIAEHMQHSLAAAAQLTFMGEVDMTEMIRLRKTLLQKEEEVGVRITFTDLFVYVLARAIQHVPIVNSSVVDDEVKVWEDINIGVAVALEFGEYDTGLIVPVVKNADQLTLAEIGRTIRDLTARAREGRLIP